MKWFEASVRLYRKYDNTVMWKIFYVRAEFIMRAKERMLQYQKKHGIYQYKIDDIFYVTEMGKDIRKCSSCGKNFNPKHCYNHRDTICRKCDIEMNQWASKILKELPKAIKEHRSSLKTLKEFRQWVIDVYNGEYNFAGNPKHNNFHRWTKEDFEKEFPQFKIADIISVFDNLISEKVIKAKESPFREV